MAITVEAVYENRMLKPDQPLPLQEHQKVQVTVEPQLTVAQETHGLMGWTGDQETFERILGETEEFQDLP